MKPNAPWIASVVVAGGVAFFAGRATSPSSPAQGAEQGSAAGTLESSRSGRLDSSGLAGGTDSKRSDRGATDDPETWDVLTDEMDRIIRNGDPLARVQAWLDFVNTLDRDQFENVVAQFREKGFTRENMAEYEMLLTAWAKVDPITALNYATANIENPYARNTILSTWATSDPQGAIAWARASHEGDGVNPFMVGVIRGIASNDPTLASQLMAEMPYSRERGEALASILPHMLSQGTDVAKAWVETIGDERLRDGAVRRLADEMMRSNPSEAAQWLADHPGNESGRGIDDALTAWANTNRDEAVRFYETLPTGEMRSNALRGLTNQLASEDPAAAAQFLDQHAADADDRVYQQFVWNSFRSAPELSANYISRMTDARQQDRMYRRMLEGWMRRDFNAATQWMTSNDLPSGVVDHMNERIREFQENQQ
ncbi:hypothetical protein HNR46_003232 [Haloferula luteola]|uniref:HEAT repeat protein n=1 Tax=Haloferula luteola TaxID=595692 RepID=A0A840V4S9_9BACT|nr:hypothetical protein [Haloferula luteola]MBB5352982.1 hypothetical protein [Haloferula luteola]